MRNNIFRHRFMNKIDLPARPEHVGGPIFNYASGRDFSVSVKGNTADIVLYDEIGAYGVSAKDFNAELAKITADVINLRINSPGGDVFDGIAIYNDLKSHRSTVNVTVTGLAASASSIIAMAGDNVEMGLNSFIMIHNTWLLAAGNKNDLRQVADILDQIDAACAQTYTDRTGISAKDIGSMMDAETWLNGDEAVAQGFADSVSNSDAAQAAYDISRFSKTPAAMKKRIESALRDAGYSKTESKTAVSEGFEVLGRRDAGRRNDRALRDAAGGQQLLRAINDLSAAMKST